MGSRGVEIMKAAPRPSTDEEQQTLILKRILHVGESAERRADPEEARAPLAGLDPRAQEFRPSPVHLVYPMQQFHIHQTTPPQFYGMPPAYPRYQQHVVPIYAAHPGLRYVRPGTDEMRPGYSWSPQQPWPLPPRQRTYRMCNPAEVEQCTPAPPESVRVQRRQGHPSYGAVGRGNAMSYGSSSHLSRRRAGGRAEQHQRLYYASKGCKESKGRVTRESDPRFVFDEAEAESNSPSARTTLMIKNIPNQYRQEMLLSLLDQHCRTCNERITDPNEPLSAYDFLYLPIDFKNGCNLGYAFVNFTSARATGKIFRALNAQRWAGFNSGKKCEVTYARVQGRCALEEHFRNSRLACDRDEYLPLVFDPPRNGEDASTGIVIGGHSRARGGACQSTASSPSGEPHRSSLRSVNAADGSSSRVHSLQNTYRFRQNEKCGQLSTP